MCPLTPVQGAGPQQDGEGGGGVAAPGVGGVHTGHVELALDHIASHQTSDLGHSLQSGIGLGEMQDKCDRSAFWMNYFGWKEPKGNHKKRERSKFKNGPNDCCFRICMF